LHENLGMGSDAPLSPFQAPQKILAEIAVGVAAVGRGGEVAPVNDAARRLLGGSDGEALTALVARLATSAEGARGDVFEAVHDAGWGEVRVVLERAGAGDGFLAALERSTERAQARQARAFGEMLRAVAASGSAEEALRRALSSLAAALPGAELAVHVVGASGELTCAALASGPRNMTGPGGAVAVGAELAGRAIRSGRPAHSSSGAEEWRAGPRGGERARRPGGSAGARAAGLAVALPVRWRGAVVGALHAELPRQSEGELRLVQGLADAAGALIGRAREEAALEAERLARRETQRRAERARAVEREGLATLGQLAACVSHEIASPLGCLRGALRAIREDLAELVGRCLEGAGKELRAAPALARELDELLRESQGDVERMTEIVRALKGLARRRPGERVAFDPRGPIEDTARIFRGAHGPVCSIELSLPEALPEVSGSPGGLAQVLLNLLSNGLDAMGGRGALRVAADVDGERWVVVRVVDHGPGLTPEARAHLFEPYFTTKPPGKGTGLGLPICREIVEGMGGRLSCESGPDGTTFTIVLPPV
jgi:signal transduction histidine kinase